MAEDIRREYPYIFDVVRQTVQYLEQQIGVQISDNEVAYLALHFGGHLEYAKREDKELRILVVCMNGVATGNMLIHELGRILPEAKLVGVTTVARLKNPQNICDLIVASVRLTAAVPVIVVNPILNDFDRKNILNHPLVRSRFGFVDTEALYQTVKKFVPAERQSEFKKELERFFLHGREEGQMVLSPDVWRLTDFLTEDRVLFLGTDGKRRYGGSRLENTSSMSVWEQAIYTTAIPLLVRSSMKVSYVENIIQRLHEAGPYMFVTKDLVLAHASPQNGVRHLDYSIGIAPEGIEFEGGKRAWIPSLAQRSVKRITGGERIALGHFSTIGYLTAARVASLTMKKGEEPRKAEDIHFTKHLFFMRDSTVGIFLVTTLLFLMISGIATMRTDLNTLDISYRSGGYGYWIIYALMQGAGFSVGIYIILAGVRLVVGEIVPAFKGIAKKAVPHAKPAVDCPILFTYAPNAVMLGFLVSFAGGIFTMLALMAVNAWYGALVVPVIVPGVAAHFFCGGTAGVFANAEGGLKGCIAGSFVHGILISLLALFVMPVLGTLNLSGTTFSDTDFCAAGILFGELARWIPENAVFAICVCCFAIPIVWQRFKKRIE